MKDETRCHRMLTHRRGRPICLTSSSQSSRRWWYLTDLVAWLTARCCACWRISNTCWRVCPWVPRWERILLHAGNASLHIATRPYANGIISCPEYTCCLSITATVILHAPRAYPFIDSLGLVAHTHTHTHTHTNTHVCIYKLPCAQ